MTEKDTFDRFKTAMSAIEETEKEGKTEQAGWKTKGKAKGNGKGKGKRKIQRFKQNAEDAN